MTCNRVFRADFAVLSVCVALSACAPATVPDPGANGDAGVSGLPDSAVGDAPITTDAASPSDLPVATDVPGSMDAGNPMDAGTPADVEAPRDVQGRDTGPDVHTTDVPADVPADRGRPQSGEGGPCGGFIANPPECMAGLVCVPPLIPDLPGTCRVPCAGGATCPDGRTCMGGACVPRPCTLFCTMGRINCGGDCCVDTNTDARHCGSCGNACSAGQSCHGGHCG